MPILNLRFEAELSHQCWLRGNNHSCKGLVWEWEAERAINPVRQNSFSYHLWATLQFRGVFLVLGAVPYSWVQWARKTSWVKATKQFVRTSCPLPQQALLSFVSLTRRLRLRTNHLQSRVCTNLPTTSNRNFHPQWGQAARGGAIRKRLSGEPCTS